MSLKYEGGQHASYGLRQSTYLVATLRMWIIIFFSNASQSGTLGMNACLATAIMSEIGPSLGNDETTRRCTATFKNQCKLSLCFFVDILKGDFMRSILSPIMSYAGIYIFSALSMPLFLSRYAEVYSRVFLEDDCTVGLVEIPWLAHESSEGNAMLEVLLLLWGRTLQCKLVFVCNTSTQIWVFRWGFTLPWCVHLIETLETWAHIKVDKIFWHTCYTW